MQRVAITIVPKEVGQIWDDILQNILKDICSEPQHVPQIPMKQLINHTYNPKYQIYQGKCHYQSTPNLCGYHATFNALCFLNLYNKGMTHYNIESAASFWSFKKRMEKFLFEIKIANKLKDQWPWKQEDILYGDFERTYNKICIDYFDDFDIFKNHNKFQLFSFTWQFQYQNLIISEDKKRQLNKLINYFKDYKKEKPIIITFMLAITNHWMLLIVVKRGQSSEYWFFDSNNRNILDLNQQQILDLVEQLDQERIKFKGKGYSQFFKKNMGVCMKDTQISLKLIVDCLEGRCTIDEYTYNRQFNIFIDELEKYWSTDISLFENTIRDYWHNINSFFLYNVKLNLLNQHNLIRFQKLISVCQHIQVKSQYGKRLHSMIKKYDTRTKI